MSTRSTITIQHADNTCESIFCHWDGYLSWNGQLLYTFYNTAEKVQELISHGDISSLGMNIGEQTDDRDYTNPKRVTNFQCSFYARDRGEELYIWKGDDISKIDAQAFNYVFSEAEGVWYVFEDSVADKRLLKDAIAQDYLEYGEDENYFFEAASGFRIPSSDYYSTNEILLKDIATAEQLARLDAVVAEIVESAVKSLVTVTRFDCAEDLSQYTDSLLFTDDEVPAAADFTDGNGININLRIMVAGRVNVEYKGETYENPVDFPDKLKELIRSGDVYTDEDVHIGGKNGFHLVYTITDAEGKEIAYDGWAFENRLSKMTPNSLESFLAGYAATLCKQYAVEIAESLKTPNQKKNKSSTEKGDR